MNVERLVRKNILEMEAYETPQLVETNCKLNQNESPFDIPEEIKRKIIERLSKIQFNRYNDWTSTALRKLLARKFSVNKNNVIVGAGIDELLYYITLAFVEKGDKTVRFSPSFAMYKICANISGAKDIMVRLNPDFSVPKEFENEAQKAKITFICTPNNPTGNQIPVEKIELLVKNTSSLICIDEAYVDFAEGDCLSLLKYDNVIILRTFSKAFAGAGIRVGFALANQKIISYLNRVKLPWNLSIFSQIAAEELIKNSEIFDKRVKEILSERKRLFAELQFLKGIMAYPSQANFILCRVENSDLIFEKLLKDGVLVRLFSSPELTNCLRVSIGSRSENDRFLDSLKRCLR